MSSLGCWTRERLKHDQCRERRLQAQAAGVPYDGLCQTACFDTNTMLPDMKYDSSLNHSAIGKKPRCSPDCSRYKETLDVFYKVVCQVNPLTIYWEPLCIKIDTLFPGKS